jgi:hypothetical protein
MNVARVTSVGQDFLGDLGGMSLALLKPRSASVKGGRVDAFIKTSLNPKQPTVGLKLVPGGTETGFPIKVVANGFGGRSGVPLGELAETLRFVGTLSGNFLVRCKGSPGFWRLVLVPTNRDEYLGKV